MSVTVGATFGRLTVTARSDRIGGGKAYWRTRCKCGGEKEVRQDHLFSGAIVSCGCFHDESARTHTVKHGHRRTRTGVTSREYEAWRSMISRCGDLDNPDYGGRGIRVCAEWHQSFEAFLRDMGPRPSAHHSIDRKDVNGDYEPGNCRWATRTEQARNTRRNRHLTVSGETATSAEWGERSGLGSGRVRARIADGWSEERAVLTPRKSAFESRAKLTSEQVAAIRLARSNGARGVDLAREYGVSQSTICDIMQGRSWSDTSAGQRKREAP